MFNKNRVEVTVISWGATIVSLKYPDKYGHVADVVLGFDDLNSMRILTNYNYNHYLLKINNIFQINRYNLLI